jgi:hypothetical protein
VNLEHLGSFGMEVCTCVAFRQEVYICVYVVHIYTKQEDAYMHSPIRSLESHIPILLAILYVATGDYASLVRHVQLLL